MKRSVLAAVAAAALAAVVQLPTGPAGAQSAPASSPSPTPSGMEVPQPSSCARYQQRTPSFVYAGQVATMTVTVSGGYDNAHLTPGGTSADGKQIVFDPPSATLTSSTVPENQTPVAFRFTPSATSTVNVSYGDHCRYEAVGRQDRAGSTAAATVRVVDAPPPAENAPPCGAPDTYRVAADRSRVPAGGTVRLTVTVRTLPCYPRERVPHDFQVIARAPGQTSEYPYELIGEGQTDEFGDAELTANPTHDSEYALQTRYSQKTTVTVDRTAGTCAGQVTGSAPGFVPVGTTVRVSGRAPSGYPVTLHLRKRGQTAFTSRAATVDPAGNWTSLLLADDDYRYFASTDYCESTPGLLQVRPTISGPATVRKGSPVTLTVRAPAGRSLGVYFRPAGGTFGLRRTGRANSSGTFLVTYRADRDYRYYAVMSVEKRTSGARLTQVR